MTDFPIRPEAADAPTSGIVDVMEAGRGRPGLIPLWVGEGDRPTPPFIAQAAARALGDGETFYTHQRGIPELRAAIARYHERLYGGSFDAERFFVTTGGMQAAQIAIRMAAGPGDEVIIPTPAWPNFAGAAIVAGARVVDVPLSDGPTGWSLDLDRIEAAVTARTRALLINSPSNPTGWTATREDHRRLLAIARRHGLWIVADEIYGRFVYDGAGRAPSFRDVAEPEDRVLYVQTFSKNWAMTGWRIGWLEVPPELGEAQDLGQVVENLVQYSTSGVPAFLQRGAVAALDEGDEFVAEQIAIAAEGRRIICDGLLATGLVDLPRPPGAFYAYFRVRGITDTKRLALDIIDRANVGLAPGSAFGAGGATHVRLCFLRRAEDLHEAVRRLAEALPAVAGRNAA